MKDLRHSANYLHSFPRSEDEAGADRQLGIIAAQLQATGRRTYIIPLGPGHEPLGSPGYVVAANELLNQISEDRLLIANISVGSGSGATHAGLLFGLRVLGSEISVTGVCVRREAALQKQRVLQTCEAIAALLQVILRVSSNDIRLTDEFLAPGYGISNKATLDAIILGAQKEGLLVDPVYTGKVIAAAIRQASVAGECSTYLFIHTGGSPALFAYQNAIEDAPTAAKRPQ